MKRCAASLGLGLGVAMFASPSIGWAQESGPSDKCQQLAAPNQDSAEFEAAQAKYGPALRGADPAAAAEASAAIEAAGDRLTALANARREELEQCAARNQPTK